MGRFFNPSTISSLVRHFQSIGVTLSPAWLKIPEKLMDFEDAIDSFFDELYTYIPRYDDFDISVHFICVTVIIPILIDVFLVFTTRDELIKDVIHLLDMAFALSFGFEVGYLVMNTRIIKWHVYVFLIAPILWFGHKIYRNIKKHRSGRPQIEDVIESIRRYYMKDLLPGTTSELDEKGLYFLLEQYDKSIILEPIKPNWFNMIYLVFFMLGFFFCFLIGCGAFPSINLFVFFKVIIAGLSLILFIIHLFVFLMIVVPCFQQPFVKIRVFIKRYALYIFLLLFDFLYIPVCNMFLDLFSFDDFSCPKGEYFPNKDNITSYLSVLTLPKVNFTCAPCITPITGKCTSLCNGAVRHYNILSPQITVESDIMKKAGPSVIYGVLFIIIGIPVCWVYLVFHNRSIIYSIPGFGDTILSKWFYLTNHLTTSGKNLFYMYRPDMCNWSIFIMCTKFFFVIITMVSERVNNQVIWVSLIGYIALFIANWIIQPYMRRFNNALDTTIYFAQALLILVPICALFDKVVPNWFSIPLSIAVSILPLFSILFVLLFKPKAISGEEYDPWACYDVDGNKVEGIIEDHIISVPSVHFLTIWQLQEYSDLKIQDMEMSDRADNEDKSLDNIDTEQGDTDVIKVSSLQLKLKIKDMEAKIDQICDATSTKELLHISSVVSLIACAVAGYYFGAVFGEYVLHDDYNCRI